MGSLPKCGAKHPDNPYTVCTYIKDHPPVSDHNGVLWAHATGFPQPHYWGDVFTEEICGSLSPAGLPCGLPKGHNIGKVDIPENHGTASSVSTIEILEELARRMARADKALKDLSSAVTDTKEKRRLTQRASGVRLALSYVDEEIQMQRGEELKAP